VVPGPEEVEFPVLLNFPAPRLKAYARETSVAEKFEAMVKLGMLNTRMKDFYNLWELSRRFDFDGATLCRSIKATFERRGTPVPIDPPSALRPTFYENAEKIAQWNGFLRKGHIEAEGKSLAEVTAALRAFLMPPLEMKISARSGKPRGHGFQLDLGSEGLPRVRAEAAAHEYDSFRTTSTR
jgi:hypothetical protein